MADEGDRTAQLMTDHDTIRRVASERDGRPAAVPEDAPEDAGAPRIRQGDDDLVAVDWETFFERFDERDLAVAARVVDGELTLDVVPRDERAGKRDRASAPDRGVPREGGPKTEDPPEAFHEAAREDANPDRHRDEPPEGS